MIVTSTSNIENYIVTNYIGLINANIVIGTNFISDFFASFTDEIGGYSYTYQDKLDRIYQKALNELKLKAVENGANALLGVHFDFDEISGKGKAMFMVTAIGTAVKVIPNSTVIQKRNRYDIYQKLYNLTLFKDSGIITQEQYETEKNNLLLSHEDEIEKELITIKSHNEQKEAIKQAQILTKQLEEEKRREEEILLEQKRKEEEAKMSEQERLAALEREKRIIISNAIEKFKTNATSIFIKVREILDLNIASPKLALDKLQYNEIVSANYEDMSINPSDKMTCIIGRFIKEGKIAAACKYCIDSVGNDDIEYAKSYIYSVYEIITFKKQTTFEIMAFNLVELKCLGKEEEAVNEFAKYSICDIEVAKQVIALL